MKTPGQSWLGRIGWWLRALAAHDVFPAFSARVRRCLYTPLGVLLLAALAALLCGFFLHPQGFVLCGGVVAVVVPGLLWPWLTLRGVRGSLSFDRSRAVEGDRVEVCLALKNRLFWSALGLVVRDGFGKQGKGTDPLSDQPAASIAAIPSRRPAPCRWPIVLACRGVYPLVRPQMATGFPFGLWENSRPLVVERSLVVWPRTFPVGPMPLVSGDQQVEGNVSRNKVGSNGDVLGVRPYRRGDSPRRIHWSQTARHDRLIVCELQSNARPRVQLVLDADPRSHCGDGPDSSREWAIRIVASLARGWLGAGVQVGAAWKEEVFPPASGQRQLHLLLDSLAALPDTPGPTLADTLNGPACRDFQDGLQVIIATDAALTNLPRSVSLGEQRWVILQLGAFREPFETPMEPALTLPVRPWLLIDAVERIPGLLRSGWKEARHGT